MTSTEPEFIIPAAFYSKIDTDPAAKFVPLVQEALEKKDLEKAIEQANECKAARYDEFDKSFITCWESIRKFIHGECAARRFLTYTHDGEFVNTTGCDNPYFFSLDYAFEILKMSELTFNGKDIMALFPQVRPTEKMREIIYTEMRMWDEKEIRIKEKIKQAKEVAAQAEEIIAENEAKAANMEKPKDYPGFTRVNADEYWRKEMLTTEDSEYSSDSEHFERFSIQGEVPGVELIVNTDDPDFVI